MKQVAMSIGELQTVQQANRQQVQGLHQEDNEVDVLRRQVAPTMYSCTFTEDDDAACMSSRPSSQAQRPEASIIASMSSKSPREIQYPPG